DPAARPGASEVAYALADVVGVALPVPDQPAVPQPAVPLPSTTTERRGVAVLARTAPMSPLFVSGPVPRTRGARWRRISIAIGVLAAFTGMGAAAILALGGSHPASTGAAAPPPAPAACHVIYRLDGAQTSVVAANTGPVTLPVGVLTFALPN